MPSCLILNNLAILHKLKNELTLAQKSCQEALGIYRKLTDQNPHAFLPYIATTLNNLGLLLADKNELTLAQKSYQEALGIYRKLADQNPHAFLPDLAMTLNNLANLQKAKNELTLAQQTYQDALGIYRKLADQNPHAFLPDLAMTTLNLSIFYLQNKPDKVKSIAFAKETLEIAILFQHVPRVVGYGKKAAKVLQANGVDAEAFINELAQKYEAQTKDE